MAEIKVGEILEPGARWEWAIHEVMTKEQELVLGAKQREDQSLFEASLSLP